MKMHHNACDRDLSISTNLTDVPEKLARRWELEKITLLLTSKTEIAFDSVTAPVPLWELCLHEHVISNINMDCHGFLHLLEVNFHPSTYGRMLRLTRMGRNIASNTRVIRLTRL